MWKENIKEIEKREKYVNGKIRKGPTCQIKVGFLV
jgi:hypothetical protein